MVKKLPEPSPHWQRLLRFTPRLFKFTSLSPQGEATRVRQVVAEFDDSVVNFGDPKVPAPLALSCSDVQATKGNGHWISDRA